MILSSPVKELNVSNVIVRWGGSGRIQVRVIVCVWISVVILPRVNVLWPILIVIPIILWVR